MMFWNGLSCEKISSYFSMSSLLYFSHQVKKISFVFFNSILVTKKMTATDRSDLKWWVKRTKNIVNDWWIFTWMEQMSPVIFLFYPINQLLLQIFGMMHRWHYIYFKQILSEWIDCSVQEVDISKNPCIY